MRTEEDQRTITRSPLSGDAGRFASNVIRLASSAQYEVVVASDEYAHALECNPGVAEAFRQAVLRRVAVRVLLGGEARPELRRVLASISVSTVCCRTKLPLDFVVADRERVHFQGTRPFDEGKRTRSLARGSRTAGYLRDLFDFLAAGPQRMENPTAEPRV